MIGSYLASLAMDHGESLASLTSRTFNCCPKPSGDSKKKAYRYMYREKSHICTSKLIEYIHTSATMLSSVSSICQMYRHLMWVYFTSSQDSIRGWRRIGGGGGMEAARMAGS